MRVGYESYFQGHDRLVHVRAATLGLYAQCDLDTDDPGNERNLPVTWKVSTPTCMRCIAASVGEQ